ncbi:MAG TPA: hypothetical protein VEI25_11030, partial [Paraburkholderia sp.]|nr:hypothetical protein [Paraburkholderia sp.]
MSHPQPVQESMEEGQLARQLQQGQDSGDIEQFDLFGLPLAPAPERGKEAAGATAASAVPSRSASHETTRLHSAAPAPDEAASASLWDDEPLPAPIPPDPVANVTPPPKKPTRRTRDVLAAIPPPDVLALAD